jgi:uncharacterized protein
VLIEACPGAGKTQFGLEVAYRLVEQSAISRVLVVVPTLAIANGWQVARRPPIAVRPRFRFAVSGRGAPSTQLAHSARHRGRSLVPPHTDRAVVGGLQSTGYAYVDARRAGQSRSQGAAKMNAVATEAMIERAGRALIDAASAPAKVILFGSRARGDASEGSDFDFLVIERQVDDRLAEAVKLRHALREFGVPVDVIVMDEGLVKRRSKVKGTMVDRALREGRVVAQS